MVLAEKAGESVPLDTFREERLALDDSGVGLTTLTLVEAPSAETVWKSLLAISLGVKVREDEPAAFALKVMLQDREADPFPEVSQTEILTVPPVPLAPEPETNSTTLAS